jgi:hypothetical protein
MQTKLVIGDIHGCYFELQALLDKAGLCEGDQIIAIGDMVDRGPETPQVVDFFKNTPEAAAIMGNHERKHIRAARHEVKLSISQHISQAQLRESYPAALTWMSGLPLYLQLESAILVHGYFEPGIPLERQNPSVLCGTMGGDRILREHYDRPWYELYASDQPIIAGHYNYTHSNQPFVYRDQVYGIDTDCVTGKALTGILLPAFRFVSVPSRGNLWAQVHRAFHVKKPPPKEPKVAVVTAWSEKQERELDQLYRQLEETSARILARLRENPGYLELTPKQQTRQYGEAVGVGLLPNLLHLTRLGKLERSLMRKLIRDPARLGALIDAAKTL